MLKRFMIMSIVICVLSLSVEGSHLFSGQVDFLKAVLRDPGSVGAIAPCSGVVGQEVSRYICSDTTSHAYLEIGGGTGALTVEIAKKLGPNDRLDVIEIDPEMCKIACERLQEYPQVHIHCCSILDWKPVYQYDEVISTLPFNVFSKQLVQGILEHVQTLCKQGAHFSYIEYILLGTLRYAIIFGEQRKDYAAMRAWLQAFRKQHQVDQRHIMYNVPPLCVYHLQF